ncbi:CshA/CshB family fibrillar adhesin-related protein, partial [Leucobacter sp. M11]|uniref:CshA/CshB family fibrillar adhesin-related protein n=1 Tax=Leucobacter sp. M11 TaxID=2993565 RepID=UPI002D80354A
MAELVAQQARSRKKSAGGRRFRRVLPSVRRLGALAAVAAVAISGLTLVSPGVGTAPAEALFATGGEGEHRNSIDWFSFEAEGPVIPGPDGTITYTNEREAGHHTLRTTCTVGDITGTTANPLSTYRSGGYVGDALPTLYNIGGPGSQNEMITGFVNTVTSTFAQFRIVCSADIIDNDTQVSTEMPLQGLVVADAESSNTVGLTHEYIQVSPIANQSFGDAATAAPGVNWRVMDRYRPANCPSFTEARVLPNTSMLNLETNGSECMANEVGNAGPGPIAVAFMEGATSADITVNGGGSTAVAIGMVLDTDFGDAPESYGEAGAFYEPTWAGDIIPANAELVNLSDESFQLATRGSPVRTLGERIDPETKQLHSHDALLDDETGVSDEDGIDPKMLPPLNTAAGQNNEIEVSCTVAPGETALLAGWIDWAHNGVFDPEDRSDTVACVNGTATLTWTVPEVEGQSTAESRTMLRLRIAETEAELTPTGLAHSGEVEDYSLESPRILATKTATPPEGTTLHPGEQVTYTLDFWNDSSVPGDVTYSDQLTEVLDNARLVGGPTMEVGGPEVTALLTGTQIDVVGRLAPDAKARVTYTVEVTAEATHGERLTNYLLLSDGSGTIVEDPPGLCLPENPRCTDHPIAVPGLYVTKLADPVSGETVTAGEHITYQLLFENWGPEPVAIEHTDDLTRVLDDATLLEETVHGVGGLDASFQNGSQSLAITGSVPAGKIGMVRYTVEVKEDGERGDDELANFLLESGSTPPTTCAPESDTCTTHPVATSDISVAKRVKDRENGSAVVAGDELTYELTFTNQGAAAGPVDHVDHLAGVLDDAELTAGPTVAPEGALGAVLDEDAQTIAITGQLAAGASVTVSYTVTVKADDDRGDDVLANFVMEGETQPPTVCEPGMDNCTTHPAEKPNVTDEKSVDPESGTGVTAGQELTYTLSFTNSGSAPGAVNRIDDLRHVLDDAEVTTPPTASDPALTPVFDAAAQTIAVTGELAPGQTVTVSYVVTVKPDGERGDDTLANFLLDPGQDPPTTPVCDPEDTDCTGNPIGAISYEKRVDASADPITAGTVLTYTVEMRNTGTATAAVQRTDVLTDVLDDAELTEEPDSNTPSVTVSEVVDERFTIGGELAAGETATVTYAVTVKAAADRGNHSAANFLVTEPGTEPPGECLPADPECTVTGLPDLRVSKQVDPESGTAVAAGQELRYTLTFANEGDGAAPVDFLDDLSGVLDDAEVTSEPTVDPEGTLTATRTAAELAISGTVPANSSVTVRYAVTVKADGQRGDSELANFLVETGTEPPTTCEPGDPCTVNPVPELTVTKSSDPASGEAVAAGEELTYTLSFSNTGAAPAALAFTDSLAGVLDDAELTGGPTVLGAGGQVVTAVFDGAAEEITITGSVPPLKIVEVTYTVTVKADGERGDNQLANFLLETGVEPPTVCLPEDEACTVHPVPELVVAKTASPASGEAVIAGQTVSYELSFENAGTAPVSVARTDHLAGVLDDADFGEGPTVRPSGALTAARDGDEIAITGTLAPGARATVSYTVTVKADWERGDEQLGNFL